MILPNYLLPTQSPYNARFLIKHRFMPCLLRLFSFQYTGSHPMIDCKPMEKTPVPQGAHNENTVLSSKAANGHADKKQTRSLRRCMPCYAWFIIKQKKGSLLKGWSTPACHAYPCTIPKFLLEFSMFDQELNLHHHRHRRRRHRRQCYPNRLRFPPIRNPSVCHPTRRPSGGLRLARGPRSSI